MPPRWRLPLLALGFISLAFGVAGGLARLTPGLMVLPPAIALHGPLMVSASSASGISILITSAPKSASCLTQVGPARTRVRSSTRKRDSAGEAVIRGIERS